MENHVCVGDHVVVPCQGALVRTQPINLKL